MAGLASPVAGSRQPPAQQCHTSSPDERWAVAFGFEAIARTCGGYRAARTLSVRWRRGGAAVSSALVAFRKRHQPGGREFCPCGELHPDVAPVEESDRAAAKRPTLCSNSWGGGDSGKWAATGRNLSYTTPLVWSTSPAAPSPACLSHALHHTQCSCGDD